MWILTFNSFRKVNITEARKLIVKLEHEFLQMLNDNKDEILNYLLFFSLDKDFVLPPYLTNVFVLNGKIYYNTYNEDRKMMKLEYSEVYDEALKTVFENGKR